MERGALQRERDVCLRRVPAAQGRLPVLDLDGLSPRDGGADLFPQGGSFAASQAADPRLHFRGWGLHAVHVLRPSAAGVEAGGCEEHGVLPTQPEDPAARPCTRIDVEGLHGESGVPVSSSEHEDGAVRPPLLQRVPGVPDLAIELPRAGAVDGHSLPTDAAAEADALPRERGGRVRVLHDEPVSAERRRGDEQGVFAGLRGEPGEVRAVRADGGHPEDEGALLSRLHRRRHPREGDLCGLDAVDGW